MGCAVALPMVVYDSGGPRSAVVTIQEIRNAEQSRFQLNREALEAQLRSEEFLFGSGMVRLGKFTDHFRGWNAHNAFILMMNATGLPGLLVLLAIYCWVAHRVWVINVLAREREDIVVARGLAVFFVAEVIAAQFTSSFTEHIFWLHAAWVEVMAVRLLRANRGTFATPGQTGAAAL